MASIQLLHQFNGYTPGFHDFGAVENARLVALGLARSWTVEADGGQSFDDTLTSTEVAATRALVSGASIAVGMSNTNTGAANTAAIAAAVAAMLLVSPGGGIVLMPKGAFDLAGTVDLDSAYISSLGRTGVTLRGAGIGSTVLTQKTAGVTTFRKTTQVCVNFEDFTLLGSDTANNASVGIEFTQPAGNCLWSNVWIQGFYSGSRFVDVTLMTFENVNWRANARNVELGFNCDIFNFNGCRLDYATDTSIYIGYRDAGHPTGALQCNNIFFNGCRISNNNIAVDVADYGASNIKFSSYFESNVSLGYFGDAAQAIGPKCIGFDGSFFTGTAHTNPFTCRHANQDSTFTVDLTRSDYTSTPGWFVLGLNSTMIWGDNALAATTAPVTNGSIAWPNLATKQAARYLKADLLLNDGSALGSVVPHDSRMTNGTGKTWAQWTRRNGTTGAVLGDADSKVIDVNGKYVCLSGPIQLVTPGAALPTAAATYRGIMVYQAGAGGVADTIKCCMKDSADAYSWKTVVTG